MLIDDVCSGGTQEDGDYMLLSQAMELGLYHPNCRHGSDTYYREREEFFKEYYKSHPELDNPLSETAADDYGEHNEAHIDNMIQRYRRLVTGSVDKENIANYQLLLDKWLDKKSAVVDKSGESGIMKANLNLGASELQNIGKIDTEKYQCVTENKIITDDVVLTDNRMEHIIERRGQQFYDEYRPFFADIVSDPDYIFKDSQKNTALVSKSFLHNGTTINLVLRLVVEGDNPNYKNSIITAIKENEKRFKQRLRNNKPLYKKLTK